MTPYEKEFEARLSGIESDANACAVFGYMESTIHYMAGADSQVFDRLNEHPYFWNTILASLQTSSFVALGRLFDSRQSPRAHRGSDAPLRVDREREGRHERGV